MKKLILFVILILMSSFAYADLSDGLVAYYPFNNNADDESGNGNDGTEYGGVNYVGCDSEFSARLDGKNDYFEMPDNLINYKTDSYVIWFKASDISDYRIISATRTADGYYVDLFSTMLMKDGSGEDGKIYVRMFGGTYAYTTDRYDDDKWHMLTYVPDGSSGFDVYMDGIKVSNGTFGIYEQGSDLLIGKRVPFQSHGGYNFKGQLDEIRIYNRALTESEILAIFENYTPCDTDNDGVPDEDDLCPNTPLNFPVDSEGCPIPGENLVIEDYPKIVYANNGVISIPVTWTNIPNGDYSIRVELKHNDVDILTEGTWDHIPTVDGTYNINIFVPEGISSDSANFVAMLYPFGGDRWWDRIAWDYTPCCDVKVISDDDNDGIPNQEDRCPDTTDWFAKKKLNPNHYDSSNMDLTTTYGCSCKQILDIKPGNNKGELEHGCTEGTMNVWTNQEGWSQSCQVDGKATQEGESKPVGEDTDGDGIPDSEDTDDDGDGIIDNEDSEPESSSESGNPDWWCEKYPNKC